MPPSPSLRRSPGREPCADSHERGCSLESGLSFKEKDDDLALFNAMHSRERENFLLQPTDDFEDIFSTKSKPFPELKLAVIIPFQGESSDLLNADADKNDYDWLLTPPETPLFASLDDEPAPVNLVDCGRPQSRPISISRSSTMEKSYGSSRGSASPQLLSPSPRSGNSSLTSRGRLSSAPYSSPTSSLRHSTPFRRPSPPPSKPSTPPLRSATPTPRHPSTGSGGTLISSRAKGASPVRTSRGNSASPKVRAWQSNIPGFSLEAPPNLHTSVANCPASCVRGSSPAPSSSRNLLSKFSRRSMSPTASRSISLPHSHERDRLRQFSKGSIASFGDDDADPLQYTPVSGLEQSVPRQVNGFPGNRLLAYSKKATKTFSPNSAPKRSFDSAMRQMDRRSPQNMFRPLLSSVPNTTFYSGKASSCCSMISRNSLLTTSSVFSSNQATGGAPETEGSDHNQGDMTSGYRQGPFTDIQDDAFAFDNLDPASGGTGHEILKGLPHSQVGEHKGSAFESGLDDFEEVRRHDAAVATDTTSEGLYVRADSMEVDSTENTLLCSRCGCRYPFTELVESEVNICSHCKLKELSTAATLVMKMDIAQASSDPLVRNSECGSLGAAESLMSVLELPDMDESKNILLTASPEGYVRANQRSYGEPRQSCFFDDFPPVLAGGESMHMHSDQQAVGQPLNSCCPSNSAYQGLELYKFGDGSLPKIDLTEGTGISVLLLKRSNSSKGPIMQSQNNSVSAISYEDSCYARDSTTSLRSSTAHGSASTSSSIDLTLAKHGEARMQWQLSSTRSDMRSQPQCNGSFSGTLTHTYQSLGITTNTCEENVEAFVGNKMHIAGETPEPLLAFENSNFPNAVTSMARTTLSEENNCRYNVSSKFIDADTLEFSSNTLSSQSEANSLASFVVDEHLVFQGIHEQFPKSFVTVANVEESTVIAELSFMEGSVTPDNVVDQMEFTEILDHKSPGAMTEIEIDDCHPGSPASQTDTASKDDLLEVSTMHNQDKEVADSVPPSNGSDHMHGFIVESTVMVEEQGGRKTRSLTLEEAADTILYCSSIVQNLVYEAVSIAIEKEKENLVPLEVSKPVVTILGKPNTKDSQRRTPGKRAAKSHKPKQRRVGRGVEPPSSKTETDDKPIKSAACIVGLPNKVERMKPRELESKCNCAVM